MTRLPTIVWFSALVAVAGSGGGLANRMYSERAGRVAGSTLSIGRRNLHGWFEIRGVRFSPDNVLPDMNLVMFGAFGRPDLSPGGLSLRVAGASAGDGIYFVSALNPESTYRLTIAGAAASGHAVAQLRCQSDDDLDRLQAMSMNLLDRSDAPPRPAWKGTGAFTPRVPGPDGASALRVELTADRGSIFQTSAGMSGSADDELHEFSFHARRVSGGSTLQFVVNREGGFDNQASVVTLTPEWRRYAVVHKGPWTGQSLVQVIFNRVDSDMVFEVAGARLTARHVYVDTPTPWMLKGWTPAGAPDRAAGVAVPLDGTPVAASVAGTQFAMLLSGDAAYQYRLDQIRLEPVGARASGANAACAITRTASIQ